MKLLYTPFMLKKNLTKALCLRILLPQGHMFHKRTSPIYKSFATLASIHIHSILKKSGSADFSDSESAKID